MPWNGSGGFSRDNGANTGATVWQDDRDAGTLIRADNHDTHDQDIADGVQACLAKNGENAMTGNLNLGSNRAVSAAAGTASTDLSTVGQSQNQTVTYAADTGAANAYVVILTPAATSYANGMIVRFKAANTNTGASTVNVNALGVKNIFLDGAALTGGEIMAGDMVELAYDGTQFAVTSFPRRKRVSGPAGNIDGPHLTFYADGDSNPLAQILCWNHGSCHFVLDAHYDGTNWVSDSAVSNFSLTKGADEFLITTASGYAVGSSISWTEALIVDTSGNVVMPNDSNGTTTNMMMLGAGNDLKLFHNGTDSRITNGTGALYFRNEATNQTTYIQAKSAAAVQRTVLACHGTTGVSAYVDGTERLSVQSNGIEINNGNVYSQSGSAGAPSFTFSADTDTGMYRSAANSLVFSAGGTASFYVSATSSRAASGVFYVSTTNKFYMQESGGHSYVTSAQTAGDLILRNTTTSREVYIKGKDAGSIERNMLMGDPDGQVYLYYNGSVKAQTEATGFAITGAIEPITDNLHDVGSASFRWDDVRATNPTIQTSDRNEKKDIAPISYGSEFIDALTPVVYRWNTGVRLHNGLIAQDVEAVLQKFNIPTSDFAGFIRDHLNDREGNPITDANGVQVERLGLRLGEFIPIMMKNLQESNAKIRDLQIQNADLEARFAAIEAKLLARETVNPAGK